MAAGEFALKSAGPWRRTKLTPHGQNASVRSSVPMRLLSCQLDCLTDLQLSVAPLQAMLALSRATLTPPQAILRLLQTTRGTTPAGERGLTMAPFWARVTPLQTIWRLLPATWMPLQAN